MCYALTHNLKLYHSEVTSEQESFEQAINDDTELPEEEQEELDVFKRMHIHVMPKPFLKDLHSTALHSPSEAVNIKSAESKAEKLDNDEEMPKYDLFLTDEFADLADTTEETSERASDDMDIDGEPSELLTAKTSNRRRFIDDVRGDGPNRPHLHETQCGIEESSNEKRRLGRTETPTMILEGSKSDGRPDFHPVCRRVWCCCCCQDYNYSPSSCLTCHHRRCNSCPQR